MKQVAIAIDQLVNTLLGGWADETLSARIYMKPAIHAETTFNPI